MPYLNMLPSNFETVVSQISLMISESSKILITGHVRPDGDSIGSISGLAKSLLKSKKNVDIAFSENLTSKFSFVLPNVSIHCTSKIEEQYDLLIVLDSTDLERTGINFTNLSLTKVINIDHHASNTYFADLNYVDVQASSACEMITALLAFAGLPLDSDVALGLILGIMTDSRFFQNEGLRYTAHLAAARLLQTGLDTSIILNSLNSSRLETDLRVQGFGLTNFEMRSKNKLVTLMIKNSDLKRLSATTNNIFASGIVNSLLSITGTIASLVTFENESGCSFCEFRSKSGFNVKDIAVELGGGGHLQASGCNQNCSPEELFERALTLLEKELEKNNH